MRALVCVVLVASLVSAAAAAPPEVPREVKTVPGQPVRIAVTVPKDGEIGYAAAFDESAAFFDELAPRAGQRRFYFQAAVPGRYPVVFWTRGETEGVVCVVVVAGRPPGPNPPGPNPPGPTPPGPDVAPIPEPGLRVLMVYDSGVPLTAGQVSVLFGRTVRDLLESKCVVGPGGRTREYRVYDKGADLSVAPKVWKDAMARPRASLPWIVVSNGKAGYEGPLPATVPEAVALVNKFAG
jgi:hypothetical protein